MKTTTFFSVIVLIFSLNNSFAQTDKPKEKPKKTGNEWHVAGDALPRSKEFADRLTKALTLDEATSKKVYNAYLANTKSVDEITFSSDSETAKKDALKTNQAELDKKFKAMLSPSQFEKYMKLGIK